MLHWHPMKVTVKPQLLTLTYKALCDQLSLLLPQMPSLVHWTCPAGFCLKAFVLADPSACNTLLPGFSWGWLLLVVRSELTERLSLSTQACSTASPCFNWLQSPQSTWRYICLFIVCLLPPLANKLHDSKDFILLMALLAPKTGPARSRPSTICIRENEWLNEWHSLLMDG